MVMVSILCDQMDKSFKIIWPSTTMKTCPKAAHFAKVGSKFCPNTKWTLKNLITTLYFLPKWRIIAKSGHTDSWGHQIVYLHQCQHFLGWGHLVQLHRKCHLRRGRHCQTQSRQARRLCSKFNVIVLNWVRLFQRTLTIRERVID